MSELDINYRHSPAAQEEGQPALVRGPKAGDRLPDAPVARGGARVWLLEAVAAPTFHLVLCGPKAAWSGEQVTDVGNRYGGSVSIHSLGREVAPHVLSDLSGQALNRLGIETTGHFLLRPDGYIGFRSGGNNLDEGQRYLDTWLPA